MRGKLIVCALLLATLAAMPAHGNTDPIGVANTVRSQGCGKLSLADLPLRAHAQLDEAARRVARGDDLETAISGSGYRFRQSAFVHVHTTKGDEGVARTLVRKFCDIVADPIFRDIGIHQRGGDTWLVLAAPFAPPGPGDAATVVMRVVDLINDARSEARRCGRKKFPAVSPLQPVNALEDAASTHARDMAAHSALGHEGSDGSMPAKRVTRAGYAWSAVAENVAAGQTTADEVVDTWLNSPGHCANLMSPRYSDTGVAYAVDSNSDKGIYWVQVFATRQ